MARAGKESQLTKPMTDILTPDICVIGAGSGGLSVAAAAAALGVPVVLIEKGAMGGDCLNFGCVPSKSLIAAGKRAHWARAATPFGVDAYVKIDFARVHDHVHGVIAAIAPNDAAERFTALGVRVIKGAARFKDAETVVVNDVEIKARRFVIATGSSPSAPPIPGLDTVDYLTNETVFDLKQCPEHLLVIGAGPIGLELAQAFRRLGAQVTVLEAASPFAKEDPECTAVVLAQLAHEHVTIRANTQIVRIEKDKAGIRAIVAGADGEEAIEASHLLVAAGRRANVDGLGLDAAGIKHEPRGILVDKRLRTSNKRVYAIGDVAGGLQFTHAANYHAGLVIRNAIFRLPVSANDDLVPRVTFTDPELAHVGLTEAQARERRVKIAVSRWPFHENDRAQAERDTHGHIKVVTTPGGKILGATIVGAEAGEMIGLWALAVAQRMHIRSMAELVLPYPVRAEVGKRAAIEFFARRLTSPALRSIIELLRRFG